MPLLPCHPSYMGPAYMAQASSSRPALLILPARSPLLPPPAPAPSPHPRCTLACFPPLPMPQPTTHPGRSRPQPPSPSSLSGSTHTQAARVLLLPASAQHPSPDSHHRPPFPPATAGNIPGTAPSFAAHTETSHTPAPRQCSPLPASTTATGRTSLPGTKLISAVQSPTPATRVCLPPRSARQTAPGTAGCAPGCAPAAPSPRPAQRECPDAAALPAPASSPAPALLPPSDDLTHPPATPACSQKNRSASLSLSGPDWPPAFPPPRPVVPTAATA